MGEVLPEKQECIHEIRFHKVEHQASCNSFNS